MVFSSFLTTAQAAAYLGYGLRAFRDLHKRYFIPTYGPRRNRFRREDLDLFMSSPVIFLDKPVTIRRARKFIS
ncbi:helix-turn-helix domain-containing protein [Fundidesulfovibrio putealis]|uniref:helix-turn-helix domain-containing protein n=1 Tax=Fundidesulfovibrio putealis TaxID=270496 RepID=UPI000416D742|nr:helix-turn-helix domain-containing protein [Fundidesulfovibrio putealis]